MHLKTGFSAIDDWVVNPTQRPHFSVASESINYLKSVIARNNEPTRVVGEGSVLIAGYNSRFELESIVPCEAIRNEFFEKLLDIVDYGNKYWGWLRLINSDQIAGHAPALDILGIGYIVAGVGTKMPPGMKLIYSGDLDIWQRRSTWPRAFFVNKFVELTYPADILRAFSDQPNVPFAAVEGPFVHAGALDSNVPYQVIPAHQYRLTNNTTRFSVNATGPGIIVLGETYYEGDFIVTANGVNVEYFRVNGAFKGIWVEHAGIYDVSFRYRPEKLDYAILMSIFGLALFFFLATKSERIFVDMSSVRRRKHSGNSGS